MAVSGARVKKIEEQVLSILNSFGSFKSSIDVKKIAELLGVSVIPYDFGDEMSGVLVLKNDKGTIGFNKDHSITRQRFTIAHELGHYILHRKNHNDVFVDRDFIIMYRRNCKYSESELLQEQEANAFAAAILMPEPLIEQELKNNNYYSTLSELELIEKLARTFKVSAPAMTFRLNNLHVLS